MLKDLKALLKVFMGLNWLFPFTFSAIFYILHFDDLGQSAQHISPTFQTAVLKCLPIMFLICLVAFHEETGEGRNQSKIVRKANIAVGLTLGCIGDACLVFEQTFVLGMLAFAIGHCFYISARGFTPLKIKLGILIAIISIIGLIFVREEVPDPLIRNAMPYYSALLIIMCWRAVAAANRSIWSKIGAAGGILFIISDFFLVLQFGVDLPYGELIVMTTYYGSQMCTALSVLDSTPF